MSTSTITELDTPQLYSSISSLSPSQTSRSPNIARTYKQASQLFVTRRVKEAFEVIEPLLQPPRDGRSREEDSNDEHSRGEDDDSERDLRAPIATASRGARVKVWSLYIALLNAIVELGLEDGKATFGPSRWKDLAAKSRCDQVWEEVVSAGYGGDEGRVDAEVVANLATLLLAHAPSQTTTQQRLETYLSVSTSPSLDVVSHLENKKSSVQAQTNGTSTPRDLNSRLKILEIYTLHVLPRNQEWEYAREFINMSEVLDEERREAFLHALQSIQDEKNFDQKREERLQNERNHQLEAARKRDAEARSQEQAKVGQDARRPEPNRTNTAEGDYGVDRSNLRNSSHSSVAAPNGSRLSSAPSLPEKRGPTTKSSKSATSNPNPSRAPSLYHRASRVVGGLQKSVIIMGQNMRTHPMLLFRFLAFLVAMIMAFSRRDVRERLGRLRTESWNKLRGTLGMGLKVTYI